MAEVGNGEEMTGDELALLRLYRECRSQDRAALLQLARRFLQPDIK
jgi:hypothetical protein